MADHHLILKNGNMIKLILWIVTVVFFAGLYFAMVRDTNIMAKENMKAIQSHDRLIPVIEERLNNIEKTLDKIEKKLE